MMLYILLCNMLFIPVIYSDSNKTINTVLNPANNLNLTYIVNEPHKDIPNQPKLIVSKGLSEGGFVSPDDTLLSLPKNSIQPNLDKELGTKKDKPVARRNGVGDPVNNHTVIQNSPVSNVDDTADVKVKNNVNIAVASKKNTTVINSINDKEKKLADNTTKNTHTEKKLNNMNESKNNITALNSSSTGLNQVKGPKKKLVLSYEALASMDESQHTNIPAIKSSSKTLVNDQMPSPNADSNEVYPKSVSRHPGMIMPAVITILVLPMFAVLGYMALRRGQEAWKNRHYKRMDFLLDGMYND